MCPSPVFDTNSFYHTLDTRSFYPIAPVLKPSNRLARPKHPLRRMKQNIKIHAPKNTNCWKQIALSSQANVPPLTPNIKLLIAIPATLPLPIPCEEDIDIQNPPLLHLLIQRRIFRHRKSHADSHNLTRLESSSKVDPTPRIIHILSPIIAMHA